MMLRLMASPFAGEDETDDTQAMSEVTSAALSTFCNGIALGDAVAHNNGGEKRRRAPKRSPALATATAHVVLVR